MRVNNHLIRLREFIVDYFKEDELEIFLFGSRAGENCDASSDIDIGIIPRGQFDKLRLAELDEEIEALNIPYKVDLVYFPEVSDSFRYHALKKVVVWKS